MRKLALLAALTALSLTPVTSAQAFNCGPDNRAAGTIAGAVIGGVTGGIISDNRGFHGHRSFRGHRGFRGNRGFHGRRSFHRDRSNGAGVILGAIAGGVIGNAIASNNTRPCPRVVTPARRFGDPFASSGGSFQTGQFSHIADDGFVDQNALKYGDPFGGRTIVRSRDPLVPSSSPAEPQEERLAGGPVQLAEGVFQPICETAFQTTELPDGREFRQPVEVCQYSEGGEWIPTN